MANEIFRMDHFAIEVISSGGFLGDTYIARTYSIRLNHFASNEFSDVAVTRKRSDFDTPEEWDAYHDRWEKRMKDFETKIADALQINLSPDDDFYVAYISKVASEISTVVRHRRPTPLV